MSASLSQNQEFHYVRTLGAEGGVAACQGPAIGLDLETLLRAGLPPWKIALEMVAGLCEILDIAEEDGEVHGDISPRFVFIDDTGAISLEGFGVKRARTRAPEGQPRGGPSDLYALGMVAYRLFCTTALPTFTTDDADAHDDAVIDAILQVDLGGVNEELQGDIQWYVAKLMAFEREERPPAVEVWRSFIAFADAVPGPSLATWCAAAVEGKGERRKEQLKPAVSSDQEQLGGVQKGSGPLVAGAIAFGDAGAAKGQATAFWSRDAMKAALDKADVEDKSYRPSVGGSTEFWSKDQRVAMKAGAAEAPRPKRTSGDGRTSFSVRPDTMEGDTGRLNPPSQATTSSLPQPVPAPSLVPMKPAPVAVPGGLAPPAGPPVHRSPTPQPVRQPLPPLPLPPTRPDPRPAPPPPVADEPAPAANKTGLLVGVGVLALVLVAGLGCAGFFGIGGLVAFNSTGSPEVAPVAVAPAPKPVAPKPAPKPEPVAPAPPPKPGVKPSPGPKPAPGARPAPAPRPTPAPAPVAPRPKPAPGGGAVRPAPVPEPGAPVTVSFRSSGRGSITCSGATKQFDGATAVALEGYQLPVTCLVNIDGARGVFQVYGTGSVTCDKVGTEVTCNPLRVQ